MIQLSSNSSTITPFSSNFIVVPIGKSWNADIDSVITIAGRIFSFFFAVCKQIPPPITCIVLDFGMMTAFERSEEFLKSRSFPSC